MGTVTILNGTNAPINSCISAGVNYSWANGISPKEFYVHNGAAGVYSLSTRFWLGKESEFSNSGWEIGLWIAGIVIGVVGLVAAIPTVGGSLLAIQGALLSSGGLAVSGISIAVKELINEPAVHTNIHAIHHRKFIAEGTVDFKKNTDGSIDWLNDAKITLRQLDETEFRSLVDSGQFVEYRENGVTRIAEQPQTVNETMVDGFFQHHFTIAPSLGGNTCWEVEGDQTTDGAPIQLWERKGAKCEWTIRSGDKNSSVFHIYNIKLDRYACATKDGRLVTSGKADASEFHIIKSNGMHVFQTTDGMMVFPEGGNLGNSTKLRVAPHAQGNPDWARWKLTLVESHHHH